MAANGHVLDEMWKPFSYGSDNFSIFDKLPSDTENFSETPLEDFEVKDKRSQEEIERDDKQREFDETYNSENFDYIYEDYRNQYYDNATIIDHIASDDTFDLDEKMQKLGELGVGIEFDAMSRISKLEKINDWIERNKNDALDCLVVYDEEGSPHPSKYYLKGERDLQWLLDNCIVRKREFISNQQYKHFYELTSRQLIASKYYLQYVMLNLKGNKRTKLRKNTRITSYSLAITTHLFDLLRDENIISATNINISDAISLVTGFSNKQAANQFSDNLKKGNTEKLNAQLKALLETLLKRLE